MALMLADKNRALFRLSTMPADINAPKLSELSGALNVANKVFLNDTYFRAANSDSNTEPFLNGDPNTYYGADKFEGQVSIARFFTDGKPSSTEDVVFDACKTKGTTNIWMTRKGCDWNAPLAVGQEVSIFVAVTDNPQEPQDGTGFEKVISPQAVQKASLYKVIVSS